MTVMAVLGAVPAAAAGSGSVDRPWKERTTGETTVFLADCVPVGEGAVECPTLIEYSVVATHVGRAELTATGTATLRLGDTCERADGLIGFPTSNVTDEVIVAADGSELHSRTVYNGCNAGFDEGNRFTGVRTITGGTGRFADATGSVDLAGTQTAVVEMTGRGTISY